MPRLAKYRSIANSVRPIEPNGTRPISTLRPDSRSHSSEPTPMPTEKIASSSVDDVLVAAQHVLGEVGELREEGRAVEPEPRDAEHRQPDDAVAVREAKVAPGLGERVPVDLEVRRDRGRLRDARGSRGSRRPRPRSRRAGEHRPVGLDGDHAGRRAILPSRIATNVPISTSPLPPTSSSLRRCCGRIAYLTGPNSVECTPMQSERERTAAIRSRR